MSSTVQANYKASPILNVATLVVATPSTLVGWNLINPDSTNAYLKIYNAAAITDVTLGTTVPVRNLLIPATGTCLLSNEDKFQINCPLGIVIAVTTTFADTGAQSAPSTGCYIELLYNSNLAN